MNKLVFRLCSVQGREKQNSLTNQITYLQQAVVVAIWQEPPWAKISEQGWLAELLQGGEREEALPSGTDSVEQLGFWLDEPWLLSPGNHTILFSPRRELLAQ